MAMAALFSADPAMMLLGTSRVVSVGRSYATLAGRDSTALNVSGLSIQPIPIIQAGLSNMKTCHVFKMVQQKTVLGALLGLNWLIFKYTDSYW